MNPPPTSIARVHMDRVDSTSRHARRLVESGDVPDVPTLYTACEQTGGVGRFGRPWSSPRGGLWCTLLWPLAPDRAAGVIDGLGLRVGVACLHAITAAAGPGVDVHLKWPNDVLVHNRKVLGVLCEVVSSPAGVKYALLGVGVNANLDAPSLPEHLRSTATTLRVALGRDVDLPALRDDLVARLAAALSTTGLDAVTLATARTALARVGRSAVVTLADRSTLSGTLVGLADDGTPVLETPAGRVTIPPGSELA
jgi:BirA family biotin operon repressor/biotin-[acetyl-CoA-carboxylase] ligase